METNTLRRRECLKKREDSPIREKEVSRLDGQRLLKKNRSAVGISGMDWEKIIFSMPDAVAVLDAGYRFVWVNTAMETFIGIPREKIIGETCYSLVHKTEKPVQGCLLQRAMDSRRRESADIEFPEKNLWLKETVDPMVDENGRFAGAIHYLSDITSVKEAERIAIRHSRNQEDLAGRLASLMDNIPGAVYRGLRDWSLTFIGADVERITGYTPEEFLSGTTTWREIIHPDDIDFVKQAFRQAVQEKRKILRVEYRTRHKDGSIRWLGDRRRLIYDAEGNFDYVDGLLLDITDRRQSEEALLATYEKLQAVIEASPLPIMALTPDGIVTLWNLSAERVFGWTPDEVIGKFNPMVPEEKRDEFRALRERVLKDGGFSGVEITRRKKDGSPIGISLSTAPLRDTRGNLTGIMAVMEDITERKQAEETIVLERDFSNAALNSLPGIFYLFDQTGKLLRWNGNFERITEYSTEEIGRMHPLDFFEDPDKRLVRERIREVFESGASSVEAELVSKSGEKITHYFTGQIFHGKGGPCLIGTGIDISERRKLEEQLQQSQKIEAIGRLAGGIAHDFNNLLTAIRGDSDLLLHRIDSSSPLRKDVEEIQKAGGRGTSLTRQLLAFSRKQVLQPKVLDLNTVVAAMEGMIRRLIGEDIDLVTVLKPGLWNVQADPGQVEQVIMNLIVNARDAIPQGGKVTIESSNVELDDRYVRRHTVVKPGEYVLLSISDTGMGMDEETKVRLFEPFYTTKEKGKGTGLGLSTVYGIVKQSGGYIWVYSEAGKGATFKVYFPRFGGVVETKKEGASVSAPRGRETVLVVEDEEVVRALVRSILEGNGYTVLTASDGVEAQKVGRSHKTPIHLIITDVVMPKMGGREAAESLAPHLPGVKVLYMSGYTDESIVHHGVLESGISFLEKPFTPDALLRKVRQTLDA